MLQCLRGWEFTHQFLWIRQCMCEMSSQGRNLICGYWAKQSLLDHNTMILFLLCFKLLSQIPSDHSQQNISSQNQSLLYFYYINTGLLSSGPSTCTGMLFDVMVSCLFVFSCLQFTYNVPLALGVQNSDSTFQLLSLLCYAHHECSYHLSPQNPVTVSLILFPIPYSVTFIAWLIYFINGSLYLPHPFIYVACPPPPSLWQPSVCFLYLYV